MAEGAALVDGAKLTEGLVEGRPLVDGAALVDGEALTEGFVDGAPLPEGVSDGFSEACPAVVPAPPPADGHAGDNCEGDGHIVGIEGAVVVGTVGVVGHAGDNCEGDGHIVGTGACVEITG